MTPYIKDDFSKDIILGKLPDVFTFEDGTRVKTVEDWRRRRQEIIDTAVELEFGGMPPVPERFELEAMQLRGGIHSYRIHIYEGDKHFTFPMQIYVPKEGFDKSVKHPVLLCGDGCYVYCNDEVVAEAHKRGWIVAKFNRVELAHDMYNTSRDTGIYPLWPDKQFSSISAWAWGYHRCVDALEQIDYADASEVAITGHSRGGKTIMLAGATDERIKYTNPNNSGTHGCGCWRYQQQNPGGPKYDQRSEVLNDMLRPVPYWFGPGMHDYAGRDGEIPHDAHFFKALCAPRCFIETEAFEDVWGNPRGSYQTYLAAKEVYKFLGVEGNITAHYREGGHNHGVESFCVLMDYCDMMREGKALPEEYTRNPFPGMEKIFDWEAPKA